MNERTPGHEAALRALESLSASLDADPERIESLTVEELQEEMREIGLDPNRRSPYLPGRSSDTSIDPAMRSGLDNVVFDTEESLSSDVPRSEAAFTTTKTHPLRLLVARDDDGTCTWQPIDALFREPQLVKKLRSFCWRFSFRCFHGVYGPEDLYQDVLIKVWKHRDKLAGPGNILSERDFQSWLFVVTRNQYLSRVRQNAKTCKRSDEQFEDGELTTDKDNSEKYFLRHFLDFIEGYSEPRQLSIRFWLEDYSYREIASMLRGRNVLCSYVTVRNWIMNAIDDFRRTLEVFDTEPARRRAVAARLIQRHSDVR
jgi:RNA polymerase sigma factor (sigma-70 family)